MIKFNYQIQKDDNGTLLILFPDIPEAVAVAEQTDDIQTQALQGLLCALDGYIDDRRFIPIPDLSNDNAIEIPALETSKILLHNEMLLQGVRKSEMARRLNVYPPQIDRLLNLHYKTKMDFVEKAAAALGKRISVNFQAA